MRSADASPTAELWSTTHAALLAGRWSIARRLLDDLARRNDYVDHLAPLASYVDALERNDAMKPLDAGFRTLLQDRIDAVNARAERNSERKSLLALSAALASVDADTLAARESALAANE